MINKLFALSICSGLMFIIIFSLKAVFCLFAGSSIEVTTHHMSNGTICYMATRNDNLAITCK